MENHAHADCNSEFFLPLAWMCFVIDDRVIYFTTRSFWMYVLAFDAFDQLLCFATKPI